MPAERIQKILARAGIASRRKADEMILEGLVTINGKIASPGDKAQWGQDAIKVNKKLLLQVEAPTYIAFNKPKSVICALQDPQGRTTLSAYMKKINVRVFPIGKLDFTSEGLILLTNDGKFVEKFQKHERVPRIYHVKVKGHPDAEMINRVEKGITVGEFDKRLVKPLSVRVVEKLTKKAVVEVVLFQDSSADLKHLFDRRGFLVEKITRKAIGQISIKELKPGEYRFLKDSQVNALLEHPELALNTLEKENEKRLLKAVRTERFQAAATPSRRSESDRETRSPITPVRKKEFTRSERSPITPVRKSDSRNERSPITPVRKKEFERPVRSSVAPTRRNEFQRDRNSPQSTPAHKKPFERKERSAPSSTRSQSFERESGPTGTSFTPRKKSFQTNERPSMGSPVQKKSFSKTKRDSRR